MAKLVNYASLNGIYNGLQTQLESNEVEVLLMNNLVITKKSNKFAWATEYLNYTISIFNPNSANYIDLVVTDILDRSLVLLLTDSVKINDIPAGFGTISYDSITGTLVIKLPEILAFQTIKISFDVKKKGTENFKLDNYASLTVDSNTIVSNIVSVIALSSICKCKANQMNLEWKNRNR